MRPPSCIPLFFFVILASWIVYGHQTHAATKQFVIKEATYQENLAAIRAAVTLSTGDEASFTITVAADDAERLVESIHSGMSVKVNPADPANGKVVVTVSVSAKKEETCEITYTIPIVESKAYTVSHGVQMTDATVSSYLNLQDRSGSNMAWSDAVVVIKELPLLRTFNVTMDSGKSTTLPIPTIQIHDIQLEEAAPEYFALDKNANRIRRTRRFTYKGKGNSKEVLAAGNIRVIQNKVLVFESRLEKDLKRGGTIRLPAEFASAEEATLQTATKAGRWNRAVSLQNGTLTYQPSDVKEYVIKNHTGSEIELDADGSDSIKIGVIAAGVLVDPVGDPGDAASANLLDMTSEKLKLHADRLGDLQHFGSNLDPSLIKSVHDEIKRLYEIVTNIAKLRASRDGIAEHLAELSGTDAEPELVTRALERLETIERDLGAEITKRSKSQADLVRLLLPYSVE